jgi:hypothetical protein
MTWNDMPMCECPCCGYKWQKDDWYDLDAGDTLECYKCKKEIEITRKEVSVYLCFEAHYNDKEVK